MALLKQCDREKGSNGAALISILVMVALLMVLITAIMLLSQSETRSAATYENQISADSLSEVATNLVISQIRTATENGSSAWASQPGAIRNYDAEGDFVAGYKLYSDDDMIVDHEGEFRADVIPDDWQTQEAQFVDLNEPSLFDGNAVFPILDPRARGEIEGFEFTEEVSGTVATNDTSARLPMPVRWIYMLQDGTTGHLDPANNRFIGVRPDGTTVTPDKNNPIIGRIAFWADDESAKVNINTASEPTFWDTPKSVSREDLWYARAQPVQKEYQRYPGHPATTALSTVLFGDQVIRKTAAQLDGNSMRSSQRLSAEMLANKAIKEAIYEITPRVNTGGSESGTRINRRGDPGVSPDLDRLYTSVDEFIFKAPSLSNNTEERETTQIIDVEKLKRSRFFLTANSRAPELNLFGLPRVSIWPTDHENRPNKHHTTFDSLIRFCSTTTAGDKYFFTRRNADSPHEDWNSIPRNQEVYSYLQELTSTPIPGVGNDFEQKYGPDRDQILTEIFDYIRCTNLFDDNHPKLFYRGGEEETQFTDGRQMTRSGGNPNATLQGHGQVAPIKIGDTMGFGRFPTFSEFSLVTICCADSGEPGQERAGGLRIEDPIAIEGPPGRKNAISVHYSNFPPLSPLPNTIDFGKTFPSPDDAPYDGVVDANGDWREGNDPRHPGYNPLNWNHALPLWENWDKPDSTPTHLNADEMVIQMCFAPESFVAMQGWSSLNSRFWTVISGLDGLRINGTDLGFSPEVKEFRKGGLSSGWHSRSWGGNLGFRSHTNFRVVSQPIRVDKGPNTFRIEQTKPITVEIYLASEKDPQFLVQSIAINFPDADFPLPRLQREGTRSDSGSPKKTSARFWWSFSNPNLDAGFSDPQRPDRNRPWHYRGSALVHGNKHEKPPVQGGKILSDSPLLGAYFFGGRLQGKSQNPSYPWTEKNNTTTETISRKPRKDFSHLGGAFWREGDVVRSLVPFHGQEGGSKSGGDYRLVAVQNEVPSDVFLPHAGYYNLGTPIDQTLYLPAGAHFYWRFGNADIHDTAVGTYPFHSYSVETQLTDARYHFSKFPDYPRGFADGLDSVEESTHIFTGDFDNGVAITPDGAFINKPDGGNRFQGWGESRYKAFSDAPTPYFDTNWKQAMQGPGYFSPNRQISSPVMFGSLPTGVERNLPWQTLLFRPQPWGHRENKDRPHPGYEDPKDHYLLDLFWMPVVEPYAISEPFSTAGKINMNYQILPFSHIKRATGMHAVLKAEEMLIISDSDAAHYKNWDHALADYFVPELPSDVQLRYLIDIDETLKQFDDRFLNDEIFRSATEICDVHLIALREQAHQTPVELPDPVRGSRIDTQVESIMRDFWEANSPTGDNSRERPYSHIYPRLTTKSNTFRVHVRAQVLKKARESDPETFDPKMDSVVGEWRGETLLERYIDPNNERIPDYATNPSLIGDENLDRFYQFRILYRNRFDG